MSHTRKRLQKLFGKADGWKFYLHHKLRKEQPLRFPYLKHPVHLRYIPSLSDHIMFEQIFYSRGYDIDIPFEPRTIFDIGANVGLAALYFANRFPDAKIIGVEPEQSNFSQAKRNTQPYPNVEILHGAIWPREETLRLLDKGFGEASFMVTSNEGEGSYELPAYTIAGLMKRAGITTVDLVKIDIEGAEMDLFAENFESWLPYTKVLLVETHDRYRPGTSRTVFETINRYDFDLEVKGENLVFYNRQLLPRG
ncbi:FkbM family methyltransferase [Flaviaesturariibacter aridisoli]|uniref:FkbM family methyltransferase n=1 Tax=Flaviaesturariibacter aridisoli TaxID=2545761 RepID=A0A4R4DXK7_9BACT|nr:FkbM family methyltransferase [Flaviaesturariibacter aridisoli]TCZ67882.1 FkbM family methyltransferase [Flaviaesturariibacter aridisoli]